MPPNRSKRYTRNRRNFQAIPFQRQIAVTALADEGVAVASLLSDVFGTDVFIISMDATWSLRDFETGKGPLPVGIAHGDLSVAEIQEATQAQVLDPDDIIQVERARRPVRKIGAFKGDIADDVINNGNMIRTRVKFPIGSGHSLNDWIENKSGGTLTTGSQLEIDGTLYVRWLR